MSLMAVSSIIAAASGAAMAAFVFTVVLAAKSVRDYSMTGPLLPRDVVRHFRRDVAIAVARLGFLSFLVALYWALGGVVLLASGAILLDFGPGLVSGFFAGLAAVGAATTVQFLSHLLGNPGVIVASSHYRVTRFYTLWRQLSPEGLRYSKALILVLILVLIGGAVAELLLERAFESALTLTGAAVALVGIAWFAASDTEPRPRKGRTTQAPMPNILMLGCDTLRADRIGASRNDLPLTSNLETLSARGIRFDNCYVPCGRTAPSLVSLLSGTWPQSHGIRDNFVADTKLVTPALPHILAESGYRTVAVSDWCGADLGKFDFGFQDQDLPDDSWNLRYLIRQGPKDLRLFLSLFARNRFGKRFLPEIYYLGGVPSTDMLGRDVRRHLSRLATADAPFMLNAFFSTTHPPFASEYPYYTLFADPEYTGPSKFAMARLTDPFEIIRRQGEPRKEFDLDQILALYDGCVRRFDDEVGRILAHLESCGLASETIIVIYSDHGMEFFEHGTWGQGNSVIGEQSARVPLIIADPRHTRATRVNEIVRSIDLAPTLLELSGLPIPEHMEGVSLAGALRGDPLPELAAYNESGIWLTDLPGMPAEHLRYPGLLELLDVPNHATGTLAIKPCYQQLVIEAKDRMIRFGRWKLTYQPLSSGVRYCLFDLTTDPACRADVAESHPEVVADLRKRLLAWLGEPAA